MHGIKCLFQRFPSRGRVEWALLDFRRSCLFISSAFGYVSFKDIGFLLAMLVLRTLDLLGLPDLICALDWTAFECYFVC